MTEKTQHRERLIDSAIDRTIDPSTPSRMAGERDLNEEKTIMAFLSELEDGKDGLNVEQGQQEDAKAAQVIKEMVERMPKPRAFKTQNQAETSNGVNGVTAESGLKHKRTATVDESDQPNRKRRSVS